ncbi:tripartite tricarboxylate transporter substrate binding protein [soil metagenome]
MEGLLIKASKRLGKLLIVGAALAGTTISASPQTPPKVIRIIVPSPPGGTMDGSARALASAMAPLLGQSIVVDNRVGAGGVIAAAYVSRADPDGGTLMLTSVGPNAIAPAMSKAASYDPVNDFTAISLVSKLPFMLVSSPALDARDIRGAIALAKAEPGRIAYASAGIGSVGHLLGEMFSSAAGVSLLHVPYQGQAPSVTALVSGEVKLSFTSPSQTLFAMIASDRIRLLGVSTSTPSRLVPGGVPIASTIPSFDIESWYGLIGPPRMAPATIERLNAAIRTALRNPDLIRTFESLGSEASGSSPAEFKAYMGTEAQRWKAVVKAANLEGTN